MNCPYCNEPIAAISDSLRETHRADLYWACYTCGIQYAKILNLHFWETKSKKSKYWQNMPEGALLVRREVEAV